MKARLLRTKDHWKPKFKVGDVIRRKPLESYNYEQPVMKIVAIRENLYLFEKKGLALEIWAQDEWELYDTWWRRLWRGIKSLFSWIFRYHQPKGISVFKHVGRVNKRPGHKMFMYNPESGEIKEYPLSYNTVFMQDGWIYRQALNYKNFIKRLKREGVMK